MTDTKTLIIDGMDCPSCVAKIEGAVCEISGVENVTLNYTNQKLKFDLGASSQGQQDSAEAVVKTIEKLGYKVSQVTPNQNQKQNEPAPSWWQTGKGRLVIVSGVLLAAATGLSFIFPDYSTILFSVAALIAMSSLARKAFNAALAGQPFTIETLMTIAVIGAILIGEAEEASVVVFLFMIGELLEMVAAARARNSVASLVNLVPKTALRVTETGVEEVSVEQLNIGDIIEIRPGDRVAADGIISQGQTSVDQAAITGESIPKNKAVGDEVFAGSIVTDGLIRIKVTKAAQDNMIARIITLVEDAQASKAPTARFIDRFSLYYTPGVIVVAALIALVPPLLFDGDLMAWIYKGLAILLIGCPCALVLSTPAAIASGISAGARHGLLMKGGAVLEAIGRVKQIAFDKTGTLTAGKPIVTDIVALSGDKNAVLGLAASVESGSSHPLAKAIISAAKEADIEPAKAIDIKALNGRGISGVVDGQPVFIVSPRYGADLVVIDSKQAAMIENLEDDGKTVALVITGKQDKKANLVGIVALRDELRADAKPAMKRLADMDISAIMLTGDNKRTANALADQLGIRVRSELLPQDKLDEIKRLGESGSIAMIGDGINDAPALAIADVGIAMGGGSDVALETADAALLHENVNDVAALVSLSRATMANIYQNISIALGLKAVFLITTLAGFTSLWMAILADTGATVLVTVNALRLLGFGRK